MKALKNLENWSIELLRMSVWVYLHLSTFKPHLRLPTVSTLHVISKKLSFEHNIYHTRYVVEKIRVPTSSTFLPGETWFFNRSIASEKLMCVLYDYHHQHFYRCHNDLLRSRLSAIVNHPFCVLQNISRCSIKE